MDILSFLQQTLGQDQSGHDSAHAIRVLSFARTIQAKEGGDLPYLEGCALLHDCLDSKLGFDNQKQVQLVRDCLLENGYEEEKADRMISTMMRMSYHLHDEKDLTLEDKIIRDADRLDALGRVGAERAIAYGKSKGRPLISEENRLQIQKGEVPTGSSTIAHFFDKLLILDRSLYTDTAKEMAISLKKELIEALSEIYEQEGLVLDLHHLD